MKKKSIWLVIIAVVVMGVVLAVAFSGRKELKLHTTRIEEAVVQVTVMATGYVQPVEEVEVGTQVSGIIEKIYVDYNSTVTKGQLLAELEKTTLLERLNQTNASLASAKSDLAFARQNYNRTKQLFDVKAATQVDLESVENQLAQAQTAYDNAVANRNQAKVNLDYAYIYSPINGVILNRAVNVGQTVAASFNTPTLFTIAEDLTKMQVEANVDEADIGQVRLGQSVTFTVDAFNDDIFNGTVSQIRLQPTVTNNVVTYTVIIEAPNPEEKLYPGMTANITVVVESETGPAVPIEATNFRMTPEVAKHMPLARDAMAAQEGFKAQHGKRLVWVKTDGCAASRVIETGIGDGVNLIVASGLQPGEEVVLSATFEKPEQKATANPLVPKPPSRGNRGGGGPGGPR